MRRFKRKGAVIATHLSTYEVGLLVSLVNQLISMVSGGQPEQFSEEAAADPFEQLAREMSSEPPAAEGPEDPVLKRLFPDAYPQDTQASSDFRRFTEHDLRAKKIADARVVLERLAATDGGAHELRIPVEEVDTWLRTLTSLRLAVATRLGVTDAGAAEELAAIDEDDPRAFMASVYDWLGFAQETLVTAL